MNIGDFTGGIYVIVRNDGKEVNMTHFFYALRGEEVKVRHLAVPVLKNCVGMDGIEVDFSVGALLQVTAAYPMFHFANVGPGDTTGQIQYEYVLGKLGLGASRTIDANFITADGQFRSLLSKKATLDS
jgi:hypothetical protein